MSEALWPYAVVLMAGALPNEVFRAMAVLLARGLSAESEIFAWIRVVAVTLLAAVVSKIVVNPPSVLATVPIWVSVASVGAGIAALYGTRYVFAAVLVGEAVFVGLAWWTGA